ncbi:DUF4365 domain-containing protein [Streptomyces sp. NPDC059629]|uniref:DUF4365 domain-containing protein n=1 Tax=Streptomyces sp. NPDC059629 TaxID=3346889 RepID=UPI003682E6E2
MPDQSSDSNTGGEMPRRPAQHRIASLAVASVRRVWNAHGHAVDEIKEDYGEDLLVQTCLNGRMDASRIWIQVKGTEKDCLNVRRGLPSIRVKAEQILRWARSADLVIVVLWDVKNDCGWFMPPQQSFNHVQLRRLPDSHFTLRFSRDLAFDSEAVERLAWAARIEHANRSLILARASWNESRNMGIESEVNFYKAVYWTLLFDFSVAAKIARPEGGFSEEFVDLLLSITYERLYERGDPAVGSAPQGLARSDIERALEEGLFLATLKAIELNCADNGAPLPLVREIADYSHSTFLSEELVDALEQADQHRTRRIENTER